MRERGLAGTPIMRCHRGFTSVNKGRHFPQQRAQVLAEVRSILLAFGCEREGSHLPRRFIAKITAIGGIRSNR